MSDKVIIEESAKRILQEAVYKGVGYLNNTNETSIDSFAKMQVSGADTIIPDNIKKDVAILGVTGTYEGGASSKQFCIKNLNQYPISFGIATTEDQELRIIGIQPNEETILDLDEFPYTFKVFTYLQSSWDYTSAYYEGKYSSAGIGPVMDVNNYAEQDSYTYDAPTFYAPISPAGGDPSIWYKDGIIGQFKITVVKNNFHVTNNLYESVSVKLNGRDYATYERKTLNNNQISNFGNYTFTTTEHYVKAYFSGDYKGNNYSGVQLGLKDIRKDTLFKSPLGEDSWDIQLGDSININIIHTNHNNLSVDNNTPYPLEVILNPNGVKDKRVIATFDPNSADNTLDYMSYIKDGEAVCRLRLNGFDGDALGTIVRGTYSGRPYQSEYTFDTWGGGLVGNPEWYFYEGDDCTISATLVTPPPQPTEVTVDNTQGNIDIIVTGDPKVTKVNAGESVDVDTSNVTSYTFSDNFSGNVHFTGTCDGKDIDRDILVSGKTICNPSNTAPTWNAEANGIMTVVSSQPTGTLTIRNNSKNTSVLVNGDELKPNSSGNYNDIQNKTFYLQSDTFIYDITEAYFTGKYQGKQYKNVELPMYESGGGKPEIMPPSDKPDPFTWYFIEGDYGEIEITINTPTPPTPTPKWLNINNTYSERPIMYDRGGDQTVVEPRQQATVDTSEGDFKIKLISAPQGMEVFFIGTESSIVYSHPKMLEKFNETIVTPKGKGEIMWSEGTEGEIITSPIMSFICLDSISSTDDIVEVVTGKPISNKIEMFSTFDRPAGFALKGKSGSAQRATFTGLYKNQSFNEYPLTCEGSIMTPDGAKIWETKTTAGLISVYDVES